MAEETSVIWKIGIHATPETAWPAAPAKGAHVTLSGWTSFGGRDRGDAANLDEDSITQPWANNDATVQAPLSQAPSDHIMLQNGAQEWEFMVYDASENIFTLDSDWSISANQGGPSTTRTKRTVLIEVNGKADIYFPKCVVKVTEVAGAVNDAVNAKIVVKPESTTSYPAGAKMRWYQAA